MSTKILNRRQARWTEFLSEFNFKIMYRPGKQGDKPDALTRRSQDLPKDDSDLRRQNQHQTVLKDHSVDSNLKLIISIPLNCQTVSNSNTYLKNHPKSPDENNGVPDIPPLKELIKNAYASDKDIQSLIEAVNNKELRVPSTLFKKYINTTWVN